MVVDDSVVVRGLMSRWINEIPGFEVVGIAANGRMAIDRAAELKPDIVLLDLDMPELDGIDALPELTKRSPSTSVIVVSTLTRRNAEISLRCLSLGAVDYLTKPSMQQEASTCPEFRQELTMRLRALAPQARQPEKVVAAPLPAPSAPTSRPASLAGAFGPRCLVIGASTGGPRALTAFLKALAPAAARLPILLVQHMPPIFTTVFAEQLAQETGLPAQEGRDGERVLPGRIYLAPGGRHMGLSATPGEVAIRLDDGAPVRHCRPAVDILFRDAAAIYGPGTLAIVLTGMGSDGTDGARAVVEAGGQVYVQDEATSTIWGMPGSIAKAGLARAVLPLDGLAPAIEALLLRRAA
jgi:two-component system chemotaxis response regulator CheB